MTSAAVGIGLRQSSLALLRMYAGIFCADSPWVGALILLGTVLDPWSGCLGLLALCSAIAAARSLGLLSHTTPASTYAFSALFLGLGASHTFAALGPVLALATFGAAAGVIATAAMSGWLQRVGLPVLSLPFLFVYGCAVSLGNLLGATWAAPTTLVGVNALAWPAPARLFLESLGALLFTPRIDVGLLIFAGLCVRGGQAPKLVLLAFGASELIALGLAVHEPRLRMGALINATFSAIVLGDGLYARSSWSYPRAALGVLLSCLFTITLADPLGRLGLSPVSLPFNLSVFAVLLIARARLAAVRPQLVNSDCSMFVNAKEQI
jgi:urea transporter